ncbi:MAG: single-stranded-DNA-specific exonuclease RecJ [Puniceicoccales bacterium]|jgi:single-stranded-DNA-specific exonuclease|nr:single-stranded-DNA-specific exonuclease RecJ [Puniceicoccales bacterium]
MTKIWRQVEYDRGEAEVLRRRLNIHPLICAIMVQRGVTTREKAERFLWPKLIHLRNPFEVKGVGRAAKRLVQAIYGHESVAIVGDYDVDGITSIALAMDVLSTFDIQPKFYVPRRSSEGYGLSVEIAERLLADGTPDLILALDCGTNAVREVSLLKSKGCDVIVVDHHKASDEECADCCIINPHINVHISDELQKTFCTVGLVFKLCHALLQIFRRQNDRRAFDFKMRDELDLVALGTIADLVSLVGENRVFCKFGLRNLACRGRRAGIDALCRVSALEEGTPVYPADVAFKLGPRLNACGRLSDAVLPVKMLLSDDYDEALTYAYELDETNRERQTIERDVTEEASAIVKKHYAQDPAIVLFSKSWHSGVVGIVSGKLARDYQRPCIVLSYERGLAKGSGRGVDFVDLLDILNNCSGLLESWGGHPLAVGVSLKLENLDAFRKRFCEIVASKMQDADFDEVIDIADEFNIDDIDDDFMRDLELLHPFGQGNPEPIFLLKSVTIRDMPELFGTAKTHIKFWLNRQYAKRILVIGWEMVDNIPPISVQLDLAIKISMDFWNGNRSKLITLVDWHSSA